MDGLAQAVPEPSNTERPVSRPSRLLQVSSRRENEHHPMERVKPPEIPGRPVPVLQESDLLGLLRACDGTDFEARRDAALIRFLLDTGARRGELVERNPAKVEVAGSKPVSRSNPLSQAAGKFVGSPI
jgi:integrase/recombinase XerC